MKIKCPQCYKQLDNYKEGDLLGHFFDEHDPNNSTSGLIPLYAFLVEKIHEKIVFLSHQDSMGTASELCKSRLIQELKSLLEDKNWQAIIKKQQANINADAALNSIHLMSWWNILVVKCIYCRKCKRLMINYNDPICYYEDCRADNTGLL